VWHRKILPRFPNREGVNFFTAIARLRLVLFSRLSIYAHEAPPSEPSAVQFFR
jgi:hypothetical protein